MRKHTWLGLVLLLCVANGSTESNESNNFNDAYQEFLKELRQNPESNKVGKLGLKALELGEALYDEGSEDLAVLTFDVVRMTRKSVGGQDLGGNNLEISRLALSRFKSVYGLKAVELIEPSTTLILELSRESRKPDRLKQVEDKVVLAEINKLVRDIERNVLSGDLDPIVVAGFYNKLQTGNISTKKRSVYAKKVYEIYREEFGDDAEQTLKAKFDLINTRPANKRIKEYERILPLMEELSEPQRWHWWVHQTLSRFYFQKNKVQQAEYHLQRAGQVGENLSSEQVIPLIKVAPKYPRGAFQQGITGYVLLEFSVSKRGTVEAPFVVESSPKHVFEEAAINAALQFRYIPAYSEGAPLRVEGVRNKISFGVRK